MSKIICEHPIKAIWSGSYNAETGKKRLQIVKETYKPTNNEHVFYIPCGRCRGCRLHKASIWADRLLAELQYHDEASFITLTYNDTNLPPRRLYWTDDGKLKLSPIHSLVLKDVQDFMKRLRKKFKDKKIRFYLAGEYGEKHQRPHYHIILFGVDFHEDRVFKKNINGFPHWESETLNKLWNKGYCDIAQVSWNDCAYVARYCMKKSIDSDYVYDSSIYEKLGFEPEFSTMSRRPGIGYQYFIDHAYDIYLTGSYVSTDKGSRQIRPNAYYDRIFDENDPEFMAQIRDERKETMWQHELELNLNTDYTYEERLLHAVVEHANVEKKLLRVYEKGL